MRLLASRGYSCRSPHGERGLKFVPPNVRSFPGWRRSPHGERGLKLQRDQLLLREKPSLSSWRAWIEISGARACERGGTCRSPHGERGLKFGLAGRGHVDFEVALLMESVD